jgi:uncharacterized membrane protein
MQPHILIHIVRWAFENPGPAAAIIGGLVAASLIVSLFGMTTLIVLWVLFTVGCLIAGYLDWQKDQAERKAALLEAQKKQQVL